MKEWKISRNSLNVAFACSAGAAISNRIIGLTGKAENFKGGPAQINLTINVTD